MPLRERPEVQEVLREPAANLHVRARLLRRAGGFMPSLAYVRTSSDGARDYDFVLVLPDCVVDEEGAATAMAATDLAEAMRISDRTPEGVAGELSRRGYVIVKDAHAAVDA